MPPLVADEGFDELVEKVAFQFGTIVKARKILYAILARPLFFSFLFFLDIMR